MGDYRIMPCYRCGRPTKHRRVKVNVSSRALDILIRKISDEECWECQTCKEREFLKSKIG